uniref:Uncharacterized protein n=1 Tax=Cyanophora paradoxa TaxID=2762 RepID=A0A097PBN0_CYAPA|nr:hypothetical protein [Cyanophora paradoxa]
MKLINKKKSFWYSKKLLENKFVIFLSYSNIDNKKEFLNKYSTITDVIMNENYTPSQILKNNNYKIYTYKNTIFKNQYLKKNLPLQNSIVGIIKYIVFSNENNLKEYLNVNKALIKNTVLKTYSRYIYLNSFYLENLNIDKKDIFKIIYLSIFFIIQLLYINYYLLLNFIISFNKTNILKK